ncbi:MAG: hypothetical protein Q4P36_08530 [Bowdeniella nasicola]|nr:hypothetical protein [Bowdeniella nasicola]
MERTVRASRAHRLVAATTMPIAGAVLGALTALALEVIASRRWLGLTNIAGWGTYVGEPVLIAIVVVAGTLGGIAFAAAMFGEALRLHVTPHQLTLIWDDARTVIPAPQISAISVCEDVIIFGPRGSELARVRNDLDRADLLTALDDAGYAPILYHDPHEFEFTTLTPADTALSDDAHKLLAARGHAVATGAHGDAELLRRRLASLGIMVRDVHRRGRRPLTQQWRVIHPADSTLALAVGS